MSNNTFIALTMTTVDFLNTFLRQLNEKKIHSDFFNTCSKIKLEFLKDNLDRIHSPELRRSVIEILKLYDEII